jgi:hypothetical protein
VWLSGILGGVATFLGFFILFGGEDDHVGFGGDLSWRVGDISLAWTYGLLIGGLVLLAIALTMMVVGRERDRVETTPLADLVWHAAVFIVVNALLWTQDFALGGGLDYAHLMTIPWGIGLAIHAIAYVVEARKSPAVKEPAEERQLQHH